MGTGNRPTLFNRNRFTIARRGGYARRLTNRFIYNNIVCKIDDNTRCMERTCRSIESVTQRGRERIVPLHEVSVELEDQ